MSPKVADPSVRDALVDAAARLIAEHQPLTTRKLAEDVGTSTMAVYTHFGSMEELRRAVRKDGFARLADYLSSVEPTDDPVAFLCELGWGYCANALNNPSLYRVMFMETPIDADDAEVGLYTFQTLVDAVQKCIDGGRFRQTDAWGLGTQLWAAVHGVITLHLATMFEVDDASRLVTATTRNLLIAFGDDPRAIDRSLDEARRLLSSSLGTGDRVVFAVG